MRSALLPALDPVSSARAAGLFYVTDDTPGIHRVCRGRGFHYLDTDGKPVRDRETLRRIKSLVLPPAWADVWICPLPHRHLQATGRDDQGRKQFRYHSAWNQVRDETKYHRMIEFGRALPRIRRLTSRDLRRRGLPREKVLATVVRLLEITLIRVGNEEYVRQNDSFGLTTMRDRHAEVNGSKVRFEFRGKSGIRHAIDLHDRRLARIVRQCQDVPGQELFQYIDAEGERHAIGSAEVNDYLRQVSGQDFTAKDLRTWAGTVLAPFALQEFEQFDSQAQAKKNLVRAIEQVARRLGNTTSVCRKCYVHPAVIDAYLDGSLLDTLKRRTEKEIRQSLHQLSPEEASVLALLQERLKKEVKRNKR